jgi:hypothetical protein
MTGIGSKVAVEEQAMPELGEVDRTLVLDDLAANFGPDSRRQ